MVRTTSVRLSASGLFDPFAVPIVSQAGAQAVKAEMNSLRSALTAFRAGLSELFRTAKG